MGVSSFSLRAVESVLETEAVFSLSRLQSLGGEGCSLLPHDHFWIASERVVTLGRVGPAAGDMFIPCHLAR